MAIYLAQRGWDVEATDVSERALDLARENVERNGANVKLYRSNLFSQVHASFDVIAFNPPMRAGETESSRLLTATLRRVGFLANLLMRLTQPVLERQRLDFLAAITFPAVTRSTIRAVSVPRPAPISTIQSSSDDTAASAIARSAQPHLEPGGRLLLVISPLEEAELPHLVDGLALLASARVDGIPGLNISTFTFQAVQHVE